MTEWQVNFDTEPNLVVTSIKIGWFFCISLGVLERTMASNKKPTKRITNRTNYVSKGTYQFQEIFTGFGSMIPIKLTLNFTL